MANQKISELSSLAEAPAVGDTLPLVDISASETKKITVSNLFTSPTFVTPALGTPASGVATNLTGTAASLTAGLATDTVTKTGTGSTYATNTSPTFVTPALGTPASGTLTSCTGLPEAGLTLADNTTANASTTAHGFLKKLDNVATNFMDGTGAWSAPAGGGSLVLVERKSLTDSAAVTFSSIGTHDFYTLFYSCDSANPSDITLTFNADGAANYNFMIETTTTHALSMVTGATGIRMFNDINGTVGGGMMITFPRLVSGAGRHQCMINGGGEENGTDACVIGAAYVSANAITSATITPSAGDMTGTISLYGWATT